MRASNRLLSAFGAIGEGEASMIIGIYGFQDAGKTKLVEETVRALVRKGYSVSSIKHTPHRKSVDSEGKDTWRHWKAGSDPVAFSSESETTIIKHSKTPVEDICGIIEREFAPDVIVIEGLKDGPFPKVAIGGVKKRKGTVLTNPTLKQLVGYVETEVAVERALAGLPGLDCGKCGLDCARLARAIALKKRRPNDCKELSAARVEVFVGGKKMPTGRFASSVVHDTVRGMLGSMKGYEHGEKVEIRLEAKKAVAKTRGRAR